MSLSVRTLPPSPDGHWRHCISEIATFSMWKIVSMQNTVKYMYYHECVGIADVMYITETTLIYIFRLQAWLIK